MIRMNKKKLEKFFTCGICFKIFEDATCLPECLHLFCWKCINEKITEDDLECCPVCSTDIGPNPAKNIRRDHIYESMKSKLFPNVAVQQESTEGSSSSSKETENLEKAVPSSMDVEDVKPLSPIKAEEDATVGSVATENLETAVPSSMDVEDVKPLLPIKAEEDATVGSVATENLEKAVPSSMDVKDVKPLLPIKPEEDATVGSVATFESDATVESVATSSEVERKEETQG